MKVGLEDGHQLEVLNLQCSPSRSLSVSSSSQLTKRGRLDQVGFLFAVTPSLCLGFGCSCLSVPLKLPRMMSQAFSTPVPHTGLLANTCQVAKFILNPYPLRTHGDSIMLMFCFVFFCFSLSDCLNNFTPAQVEPLLPHPQAHGCLDKVSQGWWVHESSLT